MLVKLINCEQKSMITEMKIFSDVLVELNEVYNGVGIPTEQGYFGIAQRDWGIEIMLDGKTVWNSGELSPKSYGIVVEEELMEDLDKESLNSRESVYRDRNGEIRFIDRSPSLTRDESGNLMWK